MTPLNPKALEAAARALIRADAEELLSKPTIENTERAITAYLSALPPPAEAGELVARLRQTARDRYSAPEHYDEGITKDMSDAADLILSLSSRLETVTMERGEFERRVGASEALTGMLDVRIKAMEAALTSIASFNDMLANDRLATNGSYALFDEPSSVRVAREALKEPQK